MSRIIHTQNRSTSRNKAMNLIRDAIAEYNNNIAINKDIAAYIVMLLDEIQKTVESTSAAWEKRDYWLKADRFRQEWSWVQEYKGQLIQVINADDWQRVGELLKRLGEKIGNDPINPIRKKKIDYKGSWEKFKQLNSKS